MIPLQMMVGSASSVGGFTLDYDVNDYPSFPSSGQICCIEIDAINARLLLIASDRDGTASKTSHLKVFDIEGDGTLTEVQSYPIQNNGEINFPNYIDWFAMYLAGSKLHIGYSHGIRTYDYSSTDGSLSLSKQTDDTPVAGNHGFVHGIVFHKGTDAVYVTSAGKSRNLTSWFLPEGADHTGPTYHSRNTYYSELAKFDDTYFWVADTDGANIRRYSVDAVGAFTELESYTTNGLATSGTGSGNQVSLLHQGGYVYAQQTVLESIPALQPTRRWPVIDGVGTLGTREDGAWDFRGDLPSLLLYSNPGKRAAITFNGHTYFIRQSDGNLDQLLHT